MTTIPTGRFVWFDYVAKDIGKAQGFFGELFNWKSQAIPTPDGSTYTMITLNDQMIGGYMPTPKGAPAEAHWLTHLQVADANATATKVQSLGGKVLKAPERMGDFGTMAIVADPLGGAFALWQPAKAEGTGDFKDAPGAFCWNELYSPDPAKSVAFYAAIGGFTEQKMDMPTGTYHVLNSEDKPRAGIMKPPMDMPQFWQPYVQVDNVDQTVEKAKKLGATVHVPGETVPGVGHFAIFQDPQGAWLGVLTPEKK